MVSTQLLSQMFVVSKTSAVKIKLVAKQVLQQACGGASDEQKLEKLLGDGKLETHEMKGIIAALHFILTSSARFNVAEDVLGLELQQLGLPKEHTEVLVLALRDGRAPLQRHLADSSLRLSRLEAMRWQVHEDPGAAGAHEVQLQMALRAQATASVPEPPARTLDFRLSADSLTLLHAELKAARELLPNDVA
jgi:hypothetical protein